MRVVIAAAGTGGHINPGIAIANKRMKEEPNSKIIFIGTKRGLETNLVPRAGYGLKTIDSYGISRELSLKNVKRLAKTIHSITVFIHDTNSNMISHSYWSNRQNQIKQNITFYY